MLIIFSVRQVVSGKTFKKSDIISTKVNKTGLHYYLGARIFVFRPTTLSILHPCGDQLLANSMCSTSGSNGYSDQINLLEDRCKIKGC